ncbi:hypothetical protein D6C89_07093 [Aureobasidium pullulans]|nr:hypothetical protein D6C89_07093 [Aureobasidium pullulans]
MRMKGKLKTKVLSFLLGPLTWVDSFDTDGKKTFTDYEAAGEDWRANDTVSTILRHIAHSERWEKEKPFCLNLPLPEGQPKSNFIGSNHTDIPICNVRGREGDFKLDIHGFAFTKLPVFQASFEDTDEIETTYLAGMEDFLKRELQADEVFIFDYTTAWYGGSRGSNPRGCFEANAAPFWRGGRRPDQGPDAAHKVGHTPCRNKSWLCHVLTLSSVWRPTFGPLEDCPIAVCDSRTLEESELLASDLVYPHYVGEKYDVKYSSQHNWYYLRGMMNDECLLIKNFDTAVDGRARFCAHCAFVDPTTPVGARARESIEVRAMVFHHGPQNLQSISGH